MREDFDLPEYDKSYLDSLGLKWETITESGVNRLLIHSYGICDGYNVSIANLYFRIIPTYPDGQIDMVYFYPHLKRSDGKQIKALANENFNGLNWQRWSRHRTQKNAWRPGIDCVETQLALVDHWLRREFEK